MYSEENSTLDLSLTRSFTESELDRINALHFLVIKEYINFYKEFNKRNSLSDHELFFSLLCKKSGNGSFLDSIILLWFAWEQISINPKIKTIIVENEELKTALIDNKKIFGDITILVRKARTYSDTYFFKLLRGSFYIFNEWIWSALFLRKKTIQNNDIVILDTFVTPSSFNNEDQFIDRYFPNYSKYLSQTETSSIVTSPILLGFRWPLEYIRLWKKINHSKKNFLLQNAFLTLSDSFKTLKSSILLPIKKFYFPSFGPLNVESLAKFELFKDFCSPRFMLSINTFTFYKKLSYEKLSIKGMVGWHENQDIDKAINLAFSKYHSASFTHGYRGYAPAEFEYEKDILPCEVEKGLIPQKIFVVSNFFLEQTKMYCPDLAVDLGPALRFQHLFDILEDGDGQPSFTNNQPDEKLDILVSLPINLKQSIYILQLFKGLSDNFHSRIKLWIKPHPATKVSPIHKLIQHNLSPNLDYELIFSPLSLVIPKMNCLATYASSAALEAIAYGIPVVMCGNANWVTHNTIPEMIRVQCSLNAMTVEDLERAILRLSSQNKLQEKPINIFHKTTEADIKKLFFNEKVNTPFSSSL
jgi:hypothetical protein